MERFRFASFVVLLVGLLAGLVGCSSKGVTTTLNAVPASITLTPNPTASMELGTNQAFTATPLNAAKAVVTTTISFQSSNTAVVNVAANGMVCAGSWDSLSNPQVCTPGPVGSAQITATAQGVSSPPTTVYVHQHIDKVTVTDLCAVSQPPTLCTIPRNSCQSLNQNSIPQNTIYEARAYSGAEDITPTVGQFTWQAYFPTVATLDNTISGLNNMVSGLSLNQVEATAKTPGISPVYASIGTAMSVPANFTTCPVQSISLTVTQATKTSKTIAATVTDTLGNVIMTQGSKNPLPLTWSSSQPAAVGVNSSGVATAVSTGGGAAITASCTPPTCNVGILPSLPTYPESVVTVTTPGNGNIPNVTAYVSSTGCGTTDGCVSVLTQITSPANTVGATFKLSATPNSIAIDRQGAKIYLGTDSSQFGSKGLMEVLVATGIVSQFPSAPGKVLAVSPDGTKLVISDTQDTPHQVYIFDSGTSSRVAYTIDNATAADFSPDSLKAFIVSNSTMYIYSKVDALQSVPLTAPANDVAFLGNGIYGFMAQADGIASFPTCWDPSLSSALGSVTGVSGATFLRPLPDGVTMIGLAPPNVETFEAQVSGTPTQSQTLGCPEPRGFLTVTYPAQDLHSVNLGKGSFTPNQMIISDDGSTAYIITPNLTSVLAYNIAGETTSEFPLAGNASPVQATLTADGTLLYVAATDGMVHVVDTVAGGDVQQVSFPQNLCQNSAGQPWSSVCKPDLIVVQP